MTPQRTGFTLIELLIVIGIILFLIKIAVPRFSKFFSKARQTEAALNLANLYSAEQTYRMEHGHFTTNLAELGWTPSGAATKTTAAQHTYTYGFGGKNSRAGTHFFVGTHGTGGSHLGSCFAHSEAFVARAALKTDDGVDLWSVDETGAISHEKTGSK